MPGAEDGSPPPPTRGRRPSDGRRLPLLLESLRLDAYIAAHGIVVNDLAGSVLVPRVLRYAIYRAAGMRLRTPNVFPGVRFAERNVSIGAGTFVNSRVTFEDVAPITVGEDCQIGMEALFVTSHHALTPQGISTTPEPRPIVVGDGCWIGARAVVLPGVTIGRGCVVAAGAVVTRDCEPFGVYAGVPARRTRDLQVPPTGPAAGHGPADRAD